MSEPTITQRVATAIENADVGFSIELTRLVDGESTFTATIRTDPPQRRDFTGYEAREDAYAWIASYRMEAKACAAIEAVRGMSVRDKLWAKFNAEANRCFGATSETAQAAAFAEGCAFALALLSPLPLSEMEAGR